MKPKDEAGGEESRMLQPRCLRSTAIEASFAAWAVQKHSARHLAAGPTAQAGLGDAACQKPKARNCNAQAWAGEMLWWQSLGIPAAKT